MKYYTLEATEAEDPHSKWSIAAGIDETTLTGTLSDLLDDRVAVGRCDAYMLAIAIIYRKTTDLLRVRTGKRQFCFSPLENRESDRDLGNPGYDKGGLRIWLLGAAQKNISAGAAKKS